MIRGAEYWDSSQSSCLSIDCRVILLRVSKSKGRRVGGSKGRKVEGSEGRRVRWVVGVEGF